VIQEQFFTAGLDFALDDIVARPGWLAGVSRRRMQAGAIIVELAVMAGAAWLCARAAGSPPLLPLAAIVVAAQAAFLAAGLYDAGRLIEPARAMRPLCAAWSVVFLAASALPVIAHGTGLPAGCLAEFYAIGLAALAVTRWRFEPVMRAWVAHGHCTTSLAIVGANEIASQLIRRLRHNRYGIRVMGVYDDRTGGTAGRILPLNRLGSVADLAASGQTIDLVVITLPLSEAARISAIIAQLRGRKTKIRILPGEMGMDLFSPVRLTRGELPGIQLMEVRE